MTAGRLEDPVNPSPSMHGRTSPAAHAPARCAWEGRPGPVHCGALMMPGCTAPATLRSPRTEGTGQGSHQDGPDTAVHPTGRHLPRRVAQERIGRRVRTERARSGKDGRGPDREAAMAADAFSPSGRSTPARVAFSPGRSVGRMRRGRVRAGRIRRPPGPALRCRGRRGRGLPLIRACGCGR
jgi:hypothetical protein